MEERGFTMIEVLISLTIFGIVAAIPLGFLNQARFNKSSDERTGAVLAAQQRLDELRLEDPTLMPASGQTGEDVEIGGRTYYVVTRYCSDNTYCTSANNRQVEVEVAYLDKSLYTVETVYTQLR